MYPAFDALVSGLRTQLQLTRRYVKLNEISLSDRRSLAPIMSEKNTMTRNAMLFLPAKVLEGVLLLMMSSLYTHIFTKEAAGAFGFVQQTMNFAYLLIAAWMANASTRYAAEEYRRDKAAALLSTMTAVYVVLCALAVLGCFVLGAVTGDSRFLPGAIMFSTYTAFTILIGTLVQLDRVKPAILFSLLSASLKLVVALLLVGGKQGFHDPTPAFVANIVADGIGAVGALFALGMPGLVRLSRASRAMLNRLLGYGVPLMGVALCSGLLTLFDRFYIYGVFGEATGGIYYYNSSIPNAVFTMLSVGVLRGVYPAVLRAWNQRSRDEAKMLLGAGVRLYLLVALPAAFGLAAVSGVFCRVFFAAGYDAGAPVIWMTAFAMVFMGLTEYASKGYELEQDTRPVLVNAAIAMVVKIIASIAFVHLFGFTGGALGSVVAFAAYFVLTSMRVRKYFMFRVPLGSVLRILGAAVLCGAAAYGCTRLPVSDLLRLVLAILAGAAVYALSLIVSGEAREELAGLLSRIKRR